MNEIAFGGGGWHALLLARERDLSRVREVFAAAADFALLSTGTSAPHEEAADFFDSGPPRDPGAAQLKLGIATAEDAGDRLSGLLDVALDYPAAGTWYVGALILRPEARGAGLGSAVAEGLARHARERGASRLRLCVVAPNRRGRAFWLSRGFRTVRAIPAATFGTRTYERFEMERPLRGRD